MMLFKVKISSVSSDTVGIEWCVTSSRTAHPWVEEKIDVLVQQSLVLLVSCTEILQKLVG